MTTGLYPLRGVEMPHEWRGPVTRGGGGECKVDWWVFKLDIRLYTFTFTFFRQFDLEIVLAILEFVLFKCWKLQYSLISPGEILIYYVGLNDMGVWDVAISGVHAWHSFLCSLIVGLNSLLSWFKNKFDRVSLVERTMTYWHISGALLCQ